MRYDSSTLILKDFQKEEDLIEDALITVRMS